MTENFNPARAVQRHALARPDACALVCQGQALSYRELAERAARLAGRLAQAGMRQADGARPRVGILASRSLGACVATLGASWAGATWVPFGLKQPEDRLIELIAQCRLSAILTDEAGAKLLTPRLLEHCPATLIHAHEEQTASAMPEPAFMDRDATAYIIFTSGSTGTPKGVMVSAGAFAHYVEAVNEVLGLRASDRVLGLSELSFDVAAHNMFATWHAGGSLHVLPAAATFHAVKFAREVGLTVWNSVPSLVGMLRQLKALGPSSLPDLRLAAFGGEPLSAAVVAAWRAAAPRCAIFNVYGPTEVTVGCMAQEIAQETVDPLPLTPGRDVLAIGQPFPGTEARIVDAAGRALPDGVPGELALAGAQLAQGYLDSPELSARKFRRIDGQRWYLSGDLALRDADGRFHCLGRIDNQVKVLGHRIELDEVDAHLRGASGADLVSSVPWPLQDGAARGIVGFIAAPDIDEQELIAGLRARMPAYMLPHRIVALPELPLNASGKVDRQSLLRRLQDAPE